MKVDIHEQLEDGTRRRIATFFWRGGEIQCDNPVLWKHLMNSNGGVIIGSRGKRYYPRDGADYLRNLRYQFAGPYLHAGPVEEEDGDVEEASAVPAGEPSESPGGDVSSLATVKVASKWSAAPGSSARRHRASGRGRSGGRLLTDLRSGTVSAREGNLSREDLEAVCGGVYRAAVAFRGLAYRVARAEMDGLLETLTRLTGVERGGMARTFEAREAYLELRYQPPSRQNYEKLWGRATRYWEMFLDVLERGEIGQALWPLYMTWEAMRCLPEHRVEWLGANGFEESRGVRPAGASAEGVLEAWERHGIGAFRKRGLSRSLLEEAFAGAESRFQAAVAAFRDADFSRAEAEARAALTIDPGLADARLLLGDILRRLDQPGPALVELQRAVELVTLQARADKGRIRDPGSLLRLARTRSCIGKTLLSEGRIRAAIGHLDRATDLLDRLDRTETSEGEDGGLVPAVHEEGRATHGLLERLYRDLGDVERADHHRKRRATS